MFLNVWKNAIMMDLFKLSLLIYILCKAKLFLGIPTELSRRCDNSQLVTFGARYQGLNF
jgi:hypothetical protein